jgi:thiol-disulfide isomerase/thioredoxin
MKLICLLSFILNCASLRANIDYGTVHFQIQHKHFPDDSRLRNLNVSLYDYVSNKFDFLKTEYKDVSDSTGLFKIWTESPVDVTIFGKRFYIEAGQEWRIDISEKGDVVDVKGKYRGNYLCWLLTEKMISKHSEHPSILSKIDDNRQLYLRRKHILDSLLTIGIVSKSCYDYANTEFFYSYIGYLLSEYAKSEPGDVFTRNKIETICNGQLFQKQENLQSKFYGFAITKYVMYMLGKRAVDKFTGDGLLNLISIVDKKFSGLQREFLFSYIYRLYCRKQGSEYQDKIDFLFPVLLKKIKKQRYKDVVMNWHLYYYKFSKPLPDSILNSWVYSTPEDSVQLRSLLKADGKNVLEFWASWCSPCIRQLREYANNIERVTNKLNVIILSIDEKPTDTFSMAKDLHIISFQLSRKADKMFSDFFSIPPIPKTIMLQNLRVLDTDFDFYYFLRSLK